MPFLKGKTIYRLEPTSVCVCVTCIDKLYRKAYVSCLNQAHFEMCAHDCTYLPSCLPALICS